MDNSTKKSCPSVRAAIPTHSVSQLISHACPLHDLNLGSTHTRSQTREFQSNHHSQVAVENGMRLATRTFSSKAYQVSQQQVPYLPIGVNLPFTFTITRTCPIKSFKLVSTNGLGICMRQGRGAGFNAGHHQFQKRRTGSRPSISRW